MSAEATASIGGAAPRRAPLARVLRTALGRRRPPLGLLLAGIAIGAAAVLPAAYLVVVCADDLAGAVEVALRSRTVGLAARSLGLALAVTAGAVAIAVPLAWLTTRTDLPARRLWATLATLPIVVPSYIGAYAFVAALGPRGALQGALEPLGVDRIPSIYGFAGAWLVLTLFTYPLVLISVRAALARVDPQLEEAARAMGRSPGSVFRTVTLPQLLPAVGAGGLLVALYVLSDFGAVSLLRFDSFTRDIYLSLQAGFDRTSAAALGMLLVIATLALLALYRRLRGGLAYHRVGPGAARRPTIVALGGWRWPAIALCLVVTLLSLGLPVGVLLYWAGQDLGSAPGWGAIATNAGNSLLVASLAAAVTAVAAVVVAVLAVRFPSRTSRAIEGAGYAGYALPGIVIALALVFFGTRAVPALYQTLAMLVAALAIHFLPLAIGAVAASLLQIPPRVEEAARSLGRGPLEVFRTITAPLAAPGVAAGAALVFIYSAKELPATLLLAPIGFETLATDVWRQTSFGFYEAAAIPALALLLLAAPALYLLGERGAHE